MYLFLRSFFLSFLVCKHRHKILRLDDKIFLVHTLSHRIHLFKIKAHYFKIHYSMQAGSFRRSGLGETELAGTPQTFKYLHSKSGYKMLVGEH